MSILKFSYKNGGANFLIYLFLKHILWGYYEPTNSQINEMVDSMAIVAHWVHNKLLKLSK